MRRFLPHLLFPLVLTSTLAAAPPELTDPARVGMSAEKLDQAVTMFEDAIAADDSVTWS